MFSRFQLDRVNDFMVQTQLCLQIRGFFKFCLHLADFVFNLQLNEKTNRTHQINQFKKFKWCACYFKLIPQEAKEGRKSQTNALTNGSHTSTSIK